MRPTRGRKRQKSLSDAEERREEGYHIDFLRRAISRDSLDR